MTNVRKAPGQLPEDGQRVLVWTGIQWIFVYWNNGQWMSGTHAYDPDEVLWWQPAPPPPA